MTILNCETKRCLVGLSYKRSCWTRQTRLGKVT